ncbi:MAG: Nramp family divalent metal transporter [Veillonellales bacterium]
MSKEIEPGRLQSLGYVAKTQEEVTETLHFIANYFNSKGHRKNLEAFQVLRYIGPGILVTVGFIDPGNWATNMAAGADYGYKLLWMITLSTVMLIWLQHNAAHLGIVTGLCLSEAATIYLRPLFSRSLLFSAVAAAAATAMAEIIGGAIALQLLFHLPVKIGAVITGFFCGWLLWSNSYKKMEKIIIGFVSMIGISFLYEISLVNIDWPQALTNWFLPSVPEGSIGVIMGVMGSMVMPHNLFLHSEVIQSRQWHLENESAIKKQLDFEFLDTLFSMLLGWAINSAMILVAAAVFFTNHIHVTELQQAQEMLKPVLGSSAAVVFAVALLFSGICSTTTAGMAGGSIFAGLFKEPYDIKDRHSWWGVLLTYGLAVITILCINDPFQGLLYSQIALSIQLPWTIFLQIRLTSSKTVMGKYANSKFQQIILWTVGIIVAVLNVILVYDVFFS